GRCGPPAPPLATPSLAARDRGALGGGARPWSDPTGLQSSRFGGGRGLGVTMPRRARAERIVAVAALGEPERYRGRGRDRSGAVACWGGRSHAHGRAKTRGVSLASSVSAGRGPPGRRASGVSRETLGRAVPPAKAGSRLL